MSMLSRETAKQTCGNRLGSVCGSRAKAMQKNEISFQSLVTLKINVMRSTMAKKLCTTALDFMNVFYGFYIPNSNQGNPLVLSIHLGHYSP